MRKIADNRSYFNEPKCGCHHARVLHKGDRNLGRCVALHCSCPKFVSSAPSSMAPQPGVEHAIDGGAVEANV